MTNNLVDDFIKLVSAENVFRSKSLKELDITDEERNEFNSFLDFYISVLGKSLEEIVECYYFLDKMVMEETYYFVRNGEYRYSKLSEVDKYVYHNPEYMEKYMIGVSVSEFLWNPHLEMIRWFKNSLSKWEGNYLEIGPGGGQYLIKAINSGRFNEYIACDISETSVELTNRYLEYKKIENKCKVINKNFFDFDDNRKFELIVMGEVLEHVEKPLDMLVKIRDMLSTNGTAFITTVINGPTLDHIYLFRTVEEVMKLVADAGLVVDDYICTTASGMSLERAIKKNMVIDIALMLKIDDR